MPSVHNGIGTWYYGKKNLQQYKGTCRACGREATLQTYDTRLYCVFLMIPVIPLGRKHIIEKCSVCSRHSVLPMDKWKVEQQKIEEAIAAWRAAPRDPEKAINALAAVAAYRERQKFLELAPEVEKNFPRDGKVLCALAAIYDVFDRAPDSERLLRTAMSVEDSEEVREAVADSLLRQNKPEEAEPYLQHIVTRAIPERVDYLYRLAQGYQTKAEHEKALTVFAQCELLLPKFSEDATFQRLREASAERLGTSKPVKPAEVVRKIKSSAARRKFIKIAPVVVIVLLAAYVGLSLFFQMRSPVYLVNGLSRLYTARINGKPYPLPPGSPVKIHVPEGNVKVEIEGAPPSIAPETVSIHSSFWKRPLDHHAFVINPDGTAILRDTKVFYAAGAGNAPPAESTYAGGKTLQSFDEIDFPFEKSPDSMQLDSHSSVAHKHELAIVDKEHRVPPDVLLNAFAQRLGPDNVVGMAKRHLLLEPDQSGYLNLLARFMPADELAEFLKPNLAKRPLLMQWHRIYQVARKQEGADEQVEREYTQMLASDPKNADLIYLAGRAASDQDRAIELYKQATASDPPSAYAFYSLCNYYMCNAQFHEAAQNAIRALELIKEDTDARMYCIVAITADGQLDQAIQFIEREETNSMPVATSACMEELYIRRLRNEPLEAANVIAHIRAISDKFTPRNTPRNVEVAEAMQAYVIGRPAEYVAKMRTSQLPESQFYAAITSGDLSTAESILKEEDLGSYGESLVYLCALLHKQQAVADRHFQQMIKLLSTGESADRAFAAALKQPSKPPPSELYRATIPPAHKAALLIALGLRNPSARGPCFDLARKLNFDRRFPHLLLKSILDAPDK